jgi:dsDNA-binding SOS-regulon protein
MDTISVGRHTEPFETQERTVYTIAEARRPAIADVLREAARIIEDEVNEVLHLYLTTTRDGVRELILVAISDEEE